MVNSGRSQSVSAKERAPGGADKKGRFLEFLDDRSGVDLWLSLKLQGCATGHAGRTATDHPWEILLIEYQTVPLKLTSPLQTKPTTLSTERRSLLSEKPQNVGHNPLHPNGPNVTVRAVTSPR